MGILRESKAFSVAIWANPFEPPPDKTSPIFWKFSAWINVKRRRQINEFSLDTDKLHRYSQKYHNDMNQYLLQWENKSEFIYDDFYNLSRFMVAKIIFNENKIHNDIFNYLSEVNDSELFSNPNFKVKPILESDF